MSNAADRSSNNINRNTLSPLSSENKIAGSGTKLSSIPLTFLSDLLSPKEKDTLFLNYLEEEFFSSYLNFFSAQIRENAGLLRTQGSSLSVEMASGTILK